VVRSAVVELVGPSGRTGGLVVVVVRLIVVEVVGPSDTVGLAVVAAVLVELD